MNPPASNAYEYTLEQSRCGFCAFGSFGVRQLSCAHVALQSAKCELATLQRFRSRFPEWRVRGFSCDWHNTSPFSTLNCTCRACLSHFWHPRRSKGKQIGQPLNGTGLAYSMHATTHNCRLPMTAPGFRVLQLISAEPIFANP
jgi:hypothetical protein